MTSSNPSRSNTVKVFSASVIAAATVSGFVAYFNGDTYTEGVQEATTLSGSTVTANGGAVTIGSTGLRSTSLLEVSTLSGSSVRASALSGSTIFVNGIGSGGVLCVKQSGQLGTCGGTVGTTGKCGPCS